MTQIINEFAVTAKECAVTILPFIATFIIFQLFFIKMSMKNLRRILFGVLISYLGLVFLISGLNLFYIPIAKAIGLKFYTLASKWIIVPLGFVLGFVMTRVEPSVQVLITDIERETGGALNKKVLTITMALGVGISLALAMLKMLLKFSLWYILVPGYIIIIILSFVTEEKFTSIALDAGGVTTGVMTTTFLLPLALGLAEGLPWSNTITDGFGLIAIVAMTPIIMVMLLGKIYNRGRHK